MIRKKIIYFFSLLLFFTKVAASSGYNSQAVSTIQNFLSRLNSANGLAIQFVPNSNMFTLNYNNQGINNGNLVYPIVPVVALTTILSNSALLFNALENYGYPSSYFNFQYLIEGVLGITDYLLSSVGSSKFSQLMQNFISQSLEVNGSSSNYLNVFYSNLQVLYKYINNILGNPLSVATNINDLIIKIENFKNESAGSAGNEYGDGAAGGEILGASSDAYTAAQITAGATSSEDSDAYNNYTSLEAVINGIAPVGGFSITLGVTNNTIYYLNLVYNGVVVTDENVFSSLSSINLFVLLNNINTVLQYAVYNRYKINLQWLISAETYLLGELSNRNLSFLINVINSENNIAQQQVAQSQTQSTATSAVAQTSAQQTTSQAQSSSVQVSQTNQQATEAAVTADEDQDEDQESDDSSVSTEATDTSEADVSNNPNIKADLLNFLKENYAAVRDGNTSGINISSNTASEFYNYLKENNYYLFGQNLTEFANFFESKM